MKLKTFLKFLQLSIYSITEVGLSVVFISSCEAGNALGWFCSGAFLVLFNGAIISLGEGKNKNNIIYR